MKEIEPRKWNGVTDVCVHLQVLLFDQLDGGD